MADYIKIEDALDAAAQYCADDDGSCSKPNADLRELLDDIENIPAADVMPVRHGRWIRFNSGLLKCSNCKNAIANETEMTHCTGRVWRFCPDCGAKMDGGGEG